MGACNFCKVDPKHPLKSCTCGKVSYCSKECQAKDWKAHKPSCPPFTVRESPGRGRGLFATRRIKEGQILLDEYPLLINKGSMSQREFENNSYPYIDAASKAKILNLHDPAENLRNLDPDTVEKLVRKNNLMLIYREAFDDEVSKIFRIVAGNTERICGVKGLYSNNITDGGLFYTLSFINHACVPNAIDSWVMGDFTRHQVRAVRTIDKDEEILVSYRLENEFQYGSREYRRQKLLETKGFLCSCSECSLEGEELQENERMRQGIEEKRLEIERLLGHEGELQRKFLQKAMQLGQQRIKLVQKLELRLMFVVEMKNFWGFSILAKDKGLTCVNDPDTYRQEALRYAKLFGDCHIHAALLNN